MVGKLKNTIDRLIGNPEPFGNRVLWKLYFFEMDKLMRSHFRNDPAKRDTVILASSGRAGNTLFRFVWMNVISLKELGGREVDFRLLYDALPFDGYFSDYKKEWNFKSLPCILKTHCMHSDRHLGFRAVHFFRNPLDNMVSGYEYLSRRKDGPKNADFTWIEKKIFNMPDIRFNGTFSEFLVKDFDNYCAYFKSWMNAGAVPASYDTLVSDNPLFYFDQVFKRLGLKVEEDILIKAIERSHRDKLRDKPQCEGMASLDSMHFIRDGSVGQWRKYFSDRDLCFVKERLSFHGLSNRDSFPESYRPLLINWPIP